jgi:hypothetical protein
LEKQKTLKENVSEWIKMDLGRREHFYLKVSNDRLVLFMQMNFASEDDFILAKNWAQELCDMRAQPNHSNAPSVNYTAKEAPQEVKDQLEKEADQHTIFYTWILFPVHVRPEKLEIIIDSLSQIPITIRESLVRMRSVINTKLQKQFESHKREFDAIMRAK